MRKTIAITILTILFCGKLFSQQQAYFVDGFHGGIYGHYPMWVTQFMVDKLTQHPEWRIGLEIEPETWDTVKVKEWDAYNNFKKIVTDKRIEFTNPTYAQPYCYNISGESLIRQFEYGIKKTHQHFPDVTYTTYSVEEPCFTSCLPQVLKLFGFKYAVLKCPNTCWGGYTGAYGGQLVNWTGPDGTSILTVPRYACEALEDNSTWQTKAWGNSDSYLNTCFDYGIKNPVGMCYQDAGWKNGPWIGYGDSIKNKSIYVTWKEYIENISAGKTDDNYHFQQEDVRVNLMWGSQVLQKIAQEVRVSENKIVMAEKIAAMANIDHEYTPEQESIDDAWRTLLMAQHHDSWIVPYNRLNKEGTWAQQISLWTNNSNEASDHVIREATHSYDLANASGIGRKGYIRVYNTLGIKRSELVTVSLPLSVIGQEVSVNNSKNELLSSYSKQVGDSVYLSFQAEIPPFGYATFSLSEGKSKTSKYIPVHFDDNGDCILENDVYKISIDASKGGIIKSLIAKKQGNKEYVDKESKFSLGELRGHFYDQGKFYSTTDSRAKITVLENSPLSTRIKIEGEIASHPFSQIITLTTGQSRIDFDLTVNWKENVGIGEYKQGENWRDNRRAYTNDKYKLNVMFPINLSSAILYKNAPFDVCESKLNNTFFNTWDSIKHNVILHWVDLVQKDGKHGFAILSDHTTSYGYGENFPLSLTAQYSGIGLWGPDYKITRPLKMKYAIIPHTEKWDKAAIPTESDKWNEPLISSFHKEISLTDKSLLNIDKPGYEITACKIEDKDHILVRLFNAEGDEAVRKISFGFPVTSAEEVDLNGNSITKIETDKESISLSIPRFGIKTLLLKKKFAPSDYVNPFIGASTSVGAAGVYHGLGKTFPGVTTPYGMVQVNPNTITGGDNSPGYSYEHKTIEGFAFTQMSGVGWFGDLGNFLVMPTTGKLKTIAGKEDGSIQGYRSLYNKETEVAEAGYYSAELTDYNIKVEATAAPHSGILRFTFPEHKQSRIQIDLARRVGGTSVYQYVKVVNDTTIQGWMKCTPDGGGWGNGEGNTDYTVHFYAQFSKPIHNYGFWSADIPDNWERKKDEVVSIPYLKKISEAPVIKDKKELEGKHLGFFTEFETEKDEVVTLKVGISFVDMDGAMKNFMAEMVDKDFEQIKKEAKESWDKELSRIKITGGTEDEKTIFYTSLYHTMIDPRIYTDVDGRYMGGNKGIYKDPTFTKRTIFSGWDVFRSQFPLQTIINPELVNDQLNSLISLAEQSGHEYYERWEILNAYSGCMIGNPTLSVLADAYMKGIRNYDIEKAYRYAMNTSKEFGNDKLGYTGPPLSISNTLEYAYTDWCISRLAKELGKTDNEKLFFQKGQAYKNIFDKEKDWFRPRKEDGSWEIWPENARLEEWYGCIESNPYQQGWFIPHDVPGMVELMGGKEKVIADLTDMFEKTPKDMLWNDYYNHANEPVHHVPFLFNRLGTPWLTQKWTRHICKKAYTNKVEGIVGNEDVGQMSAWYILTAAGIHPVCPGDMRMEITSPVFDKVEFKLDRKYFKGYSFTIIAHNNSSTNIYIQKAILNGKEYNNCHIDFSEISKGGILELFMGNQPNKNWGI